MSGPFRDPEAAERSLGRIEAIAGLPVEVRLFEDVASPDQALQNLERWLMATSSPALQLQQLLDDGELGRLLILLLGASQPAADSLIQNPELASILFDRRELAAVPTRGAIVAQGRSLLADATSYSHALDRLRFLRQRWTLPIVVNDLARRWSEPDVWRALSELAEACIELALEVVWEDQKRSKGYDGECPIMVVAFGKLGGSELNYSSDIDLVYAYRDGGEEVRLSRVCEALNRALMDRMGRGQLYRVDLRLRPFGGTGPVAVSMSALESYYELYAEAWEVQALLRSKPVSGPPELVERWNRMRVERCFGPVLPSEALEESLAMRARMESTADPSDIKRGAGGIRDAEFLAQILQLAHGHEHPSLRGGATLDAFAALETEGLMDHAVAHSLRSGYIFLRQLEHRLQFVGDQQVHVLPTGPDARHRLAQLMGFDTWRDLDHELSAHRRTIASLYRSTLLLQGEIASNRGSVAVAAKGSAQALLQWFDVLPESDGFYGSLCENRDSLARVLSILRSAPRLVPLFKQSIPLTEMLLSGEIEEEFDASESMAGLALDVPPKALADAYTTAWAHLCAQWALARGQELGPKLANLATALIRHCAKRLYAEFDIVALGSFGLGDTSLDSDADLVLLVSSPSRQADAEGQAQLLLGLVLQLKRWGAPISIDLRLRPEGRKGLLVRTYEGFERYELESMEMWERFALGQCGLVLGSDVALRLVLKAAYAQPLTPERLEELLALKRRIELERVLPQHQRRDVKLGLGGLSDIEWFVHLHEMRYPTATKAGSQLRMVDRIRSLGRAGLINAVEVEQLIEARRHLLDLRIRMGLLGLTEDVLPENPDKLDRLAEAGGMKDGNDLLAEHERVIGLVRLIYRQGLERLKA